MTDKAHGLKRRPRKGGWAWYWIAPAKDVAKGYAPKSIALDPNATDADRAARCEELHADLLAWRANRGEQVTRYTISWLIRRYKTDHLSPYHNVKSKTRAGYDAMLRIIETAIPNQRIDHQFEAGFYRPRITGHHVRQWHANCGKPGKTGNPRPARARYMIAVLRILASYAVEIGVPGAKDFRELLSSIRFPVNPARESAPSRLQVLAIVKTALEMGYRSVAITTLAQFELTERRISIIGEWDGPQWRPGWVWQGIVDWTITYHQTKVGRVERSYDLRAMPALLDMLQATPDERRIGPVVICETTGQPWRYRHYISVFRKVARAAGIGDDVWSMDMRAGGATEAGNIHGISSFDIQAAGGWADSKMAARYTRDRAGRAQKVVQMRQKNVLGMKT